MPIFDYFCPRCHHNFDELVKRYDDPVDCPECRTQANRQLAAPSFILKGSGFYSPGTFTKSKEGPKLDKEFMRLSDRDQNIELGLPADCSL